MSGVGKGATTAAIGRILKSKGFVVTAMKIDPYVNVDAGTMNPLEHGEVFVTVDGDETDQTWATTSAFDIDMTRDNYMTTGRVYQSVIERERNLEYGGRCVEVVPHVPEEVILRIERAEDRQGGLCSSKSAEPSASIRTSCFSKPRALMKLRDDHGAHGAR